MTFIFDNLFVENSNHTVDFLQYIIIFIGYIATFLTSGLLVRHFVGLAPIDSDSNDSNNSEEDINYDIGAIIGKCENFLTITLILANALTALALIFTAKSFIRIENFRRNPKYYLGGTLVNFSYSVLMGFLIRIFLYSIGHPI